MSYTNGISVFESYRDVVFTGRFQAKIHIDSIVGGTPSDPKKAEGWIRTNLGETTEEQIQSAVAETMVERGMDLDAAKDEVLKNRQLNGFKLDEDGLYIEGRHVKACLREAANIRWPRKRWGVSNKGTIGFFQEHLVIPDKRIYLGVQEPTEVRQGFVHTWRGHSIKYEEVIRDCEAQFTVLTDHDFSNDEWGELWTTAEMESRLGASRSQNDGFFSVVSWKKL